MPHPADPENDYYHSGSVGNHHVEMDYRQFSGRYFVTRMHINGSDWRGQLMHGPLKMGALSFARNSMSHFIKTVKPKTLYFSGNTSDKNDLYKHLAQHLAKKHGGKYEVAGGGHSINWEHH